MVSVSEYLKDVLCQIVASYESIKELGSSPQDLESMSKEWLRIYGSLQVLIGKIDAAESKADTYTIILNRASYYIDNYDFRHEMQTVSSLYFEDPDRVKNLQYKILESFDDKKFLERIKQVISDL